MNDVTDTITGEEFKCPTGVSIMGWFYLTIGLVGAILNGIRFLPNPVTRVPALIGISLFSLLIWFSLAILKGKKWSWYVSVIMFVSQTLGAFNKSLVSGIVAFLVSSGLLAYCFTPKVRSFFGFNKQAHENIN